MDCKQLSKDHFDELVELRRHFHANPEIGYQEFETSKKIQQYLKGLGLEPEVVTTTGVVATIKGGKPGPTILLRADMDALHQNEDTGLPFASKNPGVMHACGHDAHMAVLLVTAKILCEMRDRLCGNVKLVFQPNEEEAGALAMIEAGILDNPKVDMAFAQHIWSDLPTGKAGVAPGAVMAALEHFDIVVRGKSGHTAAPQHAIDPIPAACKIVEMAQHLQTRSMDPLDSAVILFGEIKGGTACNVIASEVTLSGTMRYLLADEPVSKPRLKGGFENILKGVEQIYGVACELKWTPSNPSMSNSPAVCDLVRAAAGAALGGENITSYYCMGGEDFAEFSHRVPSCFFFVGTGNPEKGTDTPHHHPKFDIDEDSLTHGVEIFLRIVAAKLTP
ncbi:MAG: amidohydrolase [Oscillospiraceae bacterium]|nr:amidohydrolase [Oscillospiraceae bacterium]